MPDDDINAAQKAIDEAAKSADPAMASHAIPPEPEPVPAAPEPPSEPEKQPDPVVSPLPIPETGEKIMSDILEPIPVSTVPATDTDSLTVKPEHPHSSSGGIKKKIGKGGILIVIATLLLTLPVAVYFLSLQNQGLNDVRSRATGTNYAGCRTGAGFSCCINDPSSCGGNPDQCHCGGGDACSSTSCEDLQGSCEAQGRDWTENMNGYGMTCCAVGYVDNPNGNGCVPGGGGGDDNGDDDDDTTNPTPTPTTGTAPVCQNIKIYKDGTQVANLSSLRAGDEVVLAVKGNLAPTKAHFRVNGGSWTETTTTNGSGEFTLAYTVPAGVTEFVIEGEVFTNGAWR